LFISSQMKTKWYRWKGKKRKNKKESFNANCLLGNKERWGDGKLMSNLCNFILFASFCGTQPLHKLGDTGTSWTWSETNVTWLSIFENMTLRKPHIFQRLLPESNIKQHLWFCTTRAYTTATLELLSEDINTKVCEGDLTNYTTFYEIYQNYFQTLIALMFLGWTTQTM
jgi:hypothetical protein